MKKPRLLVFSIVILAWVSGNSYCQIREEMILPNIPGYITLKCDFHMHTVFSDGVVWPNVRVEEAIAEGLDAISITDHLEYHRKEVEDNHVISYEIAKYHAKNKDLLVISGGELSASKDHFGALFLKNQDDLKLRDEVPANRIAAANDQGGFVFWNHPGWTAKYKDGNIPWNEEFIRLIKEGQIKGIEVSNGDGYWEGAYKLARDYNLTLMGNSDMHGVSYYQFQPGKHRTITLVFAKEKSVDGIREALLNHRTAIYQGDHLIGSEEFLKPLFFESLEIETEYRPGTTLAKMTITNTSDVDFYCTNKGPYWFYNSTRFFTLKAHANTILLVKTIEKLSVFSLDLVVHNLITAPGESMELAFPVKIKYRY